MGKILGIGSDGPVSPALANQFKQDFNQRTMEVAAKRAEFLAMFAAGYAQHVNLPPDRVELIERRNDITGKYTWIFRIRNHNLIESVMRDRLVQLETALDEYFTELKTKYDAEEYDSESYGDSVSFEEMMELWANTSDSDECSTAKLYQVFKSKERTPAQDQALRILELETALGGLLNVVREDVNTSKKEIDFAISTLMKGQGCEPFTDNPTE
jgi:hypothetical protein